MPGDIRDISCDVTHWETSWGHAGQTAMDIVGLLPAVGALKYTDEAAEVLKGEQKAEKAVEGVGNAAKKSSPDFVVTPNGDAIPIPKGATGPVDVVNPAGKTTGHAYTGGSGGANGKVSTVRIMEPTQPRGNSPGYPNGYVKYENAPVNGSKPQGVDPITGQTLPNTKSHFPLK